MSPRQGHYRVAARGGRRSACCRRIRREGASPGGRIGPHIRRPRSILRDHVVLNRVANHHATEHSIVDREGVAAAAAVSCLRRGESAGHTLAIVEHRQTGPHRRPPAAVSDRRGQHPVGRAGRIGQRCIRNHRRSDIHADTPVRHPQCPVTFPNRRNRGCPVGCCHRSRR